MLIMLYYQKNYFEIRIADKVFVGAKLKFYKLNLIKGGSTGILLTLGAAKLLHDCYRK